MKKLFVCAAALGLFVSQPASAQNNDHHGDKNDAATSHADRGSAPAAGNHDGQGRGTGATQTKPNDTHPTMHEGTAAGPSHTVAGQPRTRTMAAHPSQSAAGMTQNKLLPNSGDVRSTPQGRSTTNRTQNNTGFTGNAANHQQGVGSHMGNATHQNNTVVQRPDINAMRRNMQASQHFRSGSYSAPQGYHSRRWSYGERLPHGYFARNYWIADVMMFDLFAPPPGLIWVRVGDDALLIDQYSGDIVQVRYGVFY